MRAALEQRAETEQRHHLLEADELRAPCGASQAVTQVAGDGEVRKQPGVLEDIADATPLGGHRELPAGVGQNGVSKLHLALLGREQPGDDVDEGRLAAARAAEQRDDSGGRRGEGSRECEARRAAGSPTR